MSKEFAEYVGPAFVLPLAPARPNSAGRWRIARRPRSDQYGAAPAVGRSDTSSHERSHDMSLSMYQASVPVMQRRMRQLIGILDKAEAHCSARKIDPDVMINARLAPDMFPLKRQVQIASDMAKAAAARLAGTEMPKWEDDEATFAELKARLQKSVDYIGSFTPEQIDGTETKKIELKIGGQPAVLEGQMYLLNHAFAHFEFHIVTAYNILRHNGVEIGKRDFVGTF
jgi:hypothetical protein